MTSVGTDGSWIIPVLRGVHLAATMSLLGTIGFISWVLPAAPVQPDGLFRRLTRLWWFSGMTAVFAGLAWLVLEAGAIADADGITDLLLALPVVTTSTRFGNILVIQLGLLLAAAYAVRWCRPIPVRPVSRNLPALIRPVVSWPGEVARDSRLARGIPVVVMQGPPASSERGPAAPARGRRARVALDAPLYLGLGLTIAALGLQGMIGHAGASAGAASLVLSEAIHLSAAGLWLGALLPIWLCVRALTPTQGAEVCARFTPVGLACVAVIAGSGFAQAVQLVGSFPALLGTAYGHDLLLKLALFALALAAAGINRVWLVNRMADAATVARRYMLFSVGFETLLGLAIVVTASFMAAAPPAAHQAPVWPLSWQLSWVNLADDDDLRLEVVTSLLCVFAGLALMVATMVWQKYRLLALVVLVVVLAVFIPALQPLEVAAYPTSFQTSPTGFTAASIAQGAALYGPNCASCHGPEGAGDGPLAVGMRIKPADLTAPHLRDHSDGELFWWLTHGIESPEGGLAMPGFEKWLSADDRWALIDYIRAHNAGLALQRDPTVAVPIMAPAFAVTCDGIEASSTGDLQGQAVHVVAGQAAAKVIRQPGVTVVTLDLRGTGKPAPGGCIAADPAAWPAYAVFADQPPDRMAAEFLVDPNGWLRAVHQTGAPGGWRTTDDLIAAINDIIAQPIDPSAGGSHEHHH